MVKEVGYEIDGASGLVAVEAALAVIVEHCGQGGSSAESISGIGVPVAIGRCNEVRVVRGQVHRFQILK